jgi:hypothetical protein
VAPHETISPAGAPFRKVAAGLKRPGKSLAGFDNVVLDGIGGRSKKRADIFGDVIGAIAHGAELVIHGEIGGR